jgi:glycosyltransferase involved in cell wall biosynthesis/1-acyl-sn-glycerol-3-phosphate acyltransferase
MIVTVVSDVLGKENNGTTIAAMNLIRSLRAKGHEVRILCPDANRKGEPGFYVVPVLNLGPINGYVRKNEVVLAKPDRRIVRAALEGADVVHVITPFALAAAAVRNARKMGIPVTAGFHCQAENLSNHLFLMNSRLANKIIYRSFYRSIYRHAAFIHYPTQFICDVFEGETKPTPHRIVSNGVDPTFRKRPSIRPEAFADRFVILSTGRYSKEKSQTVLIRAAALSKYADRIQLVFAGAGPLESKLKTLAAKKLAVPPVFRFFRHDELLDVINYADLYVHPAEIDLEAIACIEAITCGLVPVVSDSKRSATRHFALSERNLFVVNDPVDLARRIDYWIEHPEEKRVCSEAYLGYAANFNLTECMRRMEEMLQDASRPTPPVLKAKKTFVYRDELNDDFAGTRIATKTPDSVFDYRHRSPVWRSVAFLLYHFVAIPVAFLFCRIGFQMRIRNRGVIRPYRKSGFFLYGNHTQTAADAFVPSLVSFPKKAHLIANPDAVSIPGLGQIVQMLGAIPIAGTFGGMKNMMDAIDRCQRADGVVAIYPEAHIWPYYTGIRPFRSTSFAFPIKYGTPSFAFTTTYQRRKGIFGGDRPRITVHIDGPFFPDAMLDRNAAKEKLRDQIHAAMQARAKRYNEVAYVEYRKAAIEPENDGDTEFCESRT